MLTYGQKRQLYDFSIYKLLC